MKFYNLLIYIVIYYLVYLMLLYFYIGISQ